jgi:hypothetical protein
MESLSQRLIQLSSTRVTVLCLLGFLAFTALVLPGQAQQAELRSAGSGSPDLSLIYTDDDLYQMAEAYGEAGREDYIRERFAFDLAFPLIYTAFLLTAASWLVQRAGIAGTRMQWLNLVPLLPFGFDLLENGLASLVLARYPETTPIAAYLAPVMTFLKWTSLGASFLILFVGLALAAAGKRSANID